jgi:hypothetical protein
MKRRRPCLARRTSIIHRELIMALNVLPILALFACSLQAEPLPPDFTARIQGQALLDDVEEVRSLIKREWTLSNLTNADFDAALDAIAKDAPMGMTITELAFRLQRVLALGADGHARVGQFGDALQTVPGPRPNFLIDLAGNRYVALRIEHDPISRVNPWQNYRFAPLRDGYPYLVALDGVPVARYVEAAMPFVCQGTPTARRWRATELLRDLPALRREMKLPSPAHILVKLASTDGKSEVEFSAPVARDRRHAFQVPRPAESRLVDDEDFGYLWLGDCLGLGVKTFLQEWPKLQKTKGLILDLRDNEGGMLQLLDEVAARLLPTDRPRKAVGTWVNPKGDRHTFSGGLEVTPDTHGLSAAGRAVVTDFKKWFKPAWRPPKGRETESRIHLLARFDAESGLRGNDPGRPKTPGYDKPVVVLFNHRTFSAAEIFAASLRRLDNVTLVGTATTAGGGGTESWRAPLKHSRLRLILASGVYLRADGTLIDGRGVAPDIVVEPDADTYIGGRDRMLDKAIEALKMKAGGRK